MDVSQKTDRVKFTFYTLCLPFIGHDTVIQTNSVKSWLELGPQVEVLLLGDEFGVADFSEKTKARHIPEVERNELGHFAVNDLFRLAHEHARGDVLVFMDADVIALPGILQVLEKQAEYYGDFLAVGFRQALPVPGWVNFREGWADRLWDKFERQGKQFHKGLGSGTDFYAYPNGLFVDSGMPDFSVGAGHWDGWPMWYALQWAIPLIDVSPIARMIHQNHRHRSWRRGKPTERNMALCDGGEKWAWVHDATHPHIRPDG